MSGRRSVAHMAPQHQAGPIPIGWTLEFEAKKEGTKMPFYYCPGTGQQFYTYFELVRYVKYAQRKRFGIYEPSCKSVKRIRSIEKDSNATKSKKISALLIGKKTSSKSNSSTVGPSLDSRASASSGCTDREKDPDYLSESEINVTSNQNLNEELDEQESDD